MLQNWPAYALAFIALIGVVSALMPLGGTFWLAQIISTVLRAIYSVLFSIFRFFLMLLFMLIALLSGKSPQNVPQQPPPAPPPQIQAQPPAVNHMPPWLGGLVFWILIALLLGYAAYIYFSGKGFNFAWLKKLWLMIRERWLQLFGAFKEWQVTHLRTSKQTEGADNQSGRRGGLLSWLRLRNMDPNQRVRYYYLSILQHAEESGMPRRKSETPLRYAPRLARSVAQAEDGHGDIESLTQAFVEARYANTHIDTDRLPELKQIWNRIKRVLRLSAAPH